MPDTKPDLADSCGLDLSEPQIAWTKVAPGTLIARLKHMTLRCHLVVGHEDKRWWWGVYAAEIEQFDILNDDSFAPHLIDSAGEYEDDLPETEEIACSRAEQAARDWLAGVDRFSEGDEIEVELGWLAGFYDIREDLDRSGADPRAVIMLKRGPDLPPDTDPSESAWDAPQIGDLNWWPEGDAHAAEIVDRWERYQAMRDVARASAETQAEQAARVGGALDACRDMSEGPAEEPKKLERPDRQPDAVRGERMLAVVRLSPEAKANIADQIVAQLRAIKQVRAEARASAKEYREKIEALVEESEKLAERYERGGDKEIRPHRIEMFIEEGLAAVVREDTGELVEVRELYVNERQGELPLEAAAREAAEADDAPAPWVISAGMTLISNDSGRRVRVIQLIRSEQTGILNVSTHKLRTDGTLDGRAKPSVSPATAIYEAYHPEVPPSIPKPPAEDDPAGPPTEEG